MQAQDFNKYGFDLIYRIDCLESPRELVRAKEGIAFVNEETKLRLPMCHLNLVSNYLL